ncbi:MAG: hypothetical protein RMK94_17105 [Armatimonadota bacterium]|nr:hypothetical protein [Armatimonadota bacterium]
MGGRGSCRAKNSSGRKIVRLAGRDLKISPCPQISARQRHFFRKGFAVLGWLNLRQTEKTFLHVQVKPVRNLTDSLPPHYDTDELPILVTARNMPNFWAMLSYRSLRGSAVMRTKRGRSAKNRGEQQWCDGTTF